MRKKFLKKNRKVLWFIYGFSFFFFWNIFVTEKNKQNLTVSEGLAQVCEIIIDSNVITVILISTSKTYIIIN